LLTTKLFIKVDKILENKKANNNIKQNFEYLFNIFDFFLLFLIFKIFFDFVLSIFFKQQN